MTEDDGGVRIVEVDVVSPDASVRIRASLGGDVAVQVDGLHQHSEQTLAAQVSAVARRALSGLQRATEPGAEAAPGAGRPGPAWL